MSGRALDLRLQWLIAIGLVGWVLYLLGPVLTPFVAAALFAYLFNPLVAWLQRLGLGRVLAVTLVFLVLTLALIGIALVLVPFVERQIAKFINQFPTWVVWYQQVATPWLSAHFGISPVAVDGQQIVTMLQDYWKEAGGFAATVVAKVSKSGLALIGWLVNLLIVPVVAFYLLRDWDLLIERVHNLIPLSVEPTVVRLAHESDRTLGGFLRGQVTVMIVLGFIYGIGLWLVGIDVGPLIGMIAGLISFVPYLGAIIGVLMAIVAALVQYQDGFHLMLVLIVFVVGQSLEGYVLVPKLVGDKIGMHPVAVIFAVLAGGELFGFIGVLLALPVAAVAMVVLRHLYSRYTESEFYQHDGDPIASSRIVISERPNATRPTDKDSAIPAAGAASNDDGGET